MSKTTTNEQPQTKRCPACGEAKPRDDFYHNRCARDGMSAYCKPCHKAAVAAAKRRHPEAAQQWRAAHRAQAVETTRAWRKAHPDRLQAQAERARRRKGSVSLKERAARRAAILDRYVAGVTLAEIAAEFGITRQRAQQIVIAELHRRRMRLVRAFRLVPLDDGPAVAEPDDTDDGEEMAAWAQ